MEQISNQHFWCAVLLVLLIVLIFKTWERPEKGSFCGANPDPGAASEAYALYQLGTRANTTTPFVPPPACVKNVDVAAISEAQALQHAHGLAPGSPYYTPTPLKKKETFSCGEPNPEAQEEKNMLYQLQGPKWGEDFDGLIHQTLTREQAAAKAAKSQKTYGPSARSAIAAGMKSGFEN